MLTNERLKRLEQVKALVDESASEPVLRGAGVPVHVVSALARGQSTIEIVEDYPILTIQQVEAAVEYAKVYPRTGRPLPTRSLKRMLGDLATAGVWDLENNFPQWSYNPFRDDLFARRRRARELRPGGNAHVRAWYATVSTASLRISAMTFFGKRRGAERLRKTDPVRATGLLIVIDALDAAYGSRFIPIDGPSSRNGRACLARRTRTNGTARLPQPRGFPAWYWSHENLAHVMAVTSTSSTTSALLPR